MDAHLLTALSGHYGHDFARVERALAYKAIVRVAHLAFGDPRLAACTGIEVVVVLADDVASQHAATRALFEHVLVLRWLGLFARTGWLVPLEAALDVALRSGRVVNRGL